MYSTSLAAKACVLWLSILIVQFDFSTHGKYWTTGGETSAQAPQKLLPQALQIVLRIEIPAEM